MTGPNFIYTFGDISEKWSDGTSNSYPASDDYDNLHRVGIAAGVGCELDHLYMAAIYKRTLTMAYDNYKFHNQNIALELGYNF